MTVTAHTLQETIPIMSVFARAASAIVGPIVS